MEKEGPLTVEEISQRIRTDAESTLRALLELRAEGEVEAIGD
ncbi:MAG: hypothetical protein QXG32_00705 [Candidatus Bathyarchaeia archaeon]